MGRIILFCILLTTLYSFNATAGGFGDVALNVFEPVSVIIQLIRGVSIICGVGLLLGGILRFIEHRRNPMQVRLSTVIFMFIFGVGLIIVGLIPMHLMFKD